MDNVPAARGYTGGFGTDLMLKDLGLATEAAKEAKQTVVMGAVAQQLYQMWSAQGAGSQDFSGIVNLYKPHAHRG
jgi:3-hydroxyisobutyrate dehydrogenase